MFCLMHNNSYLLRFMCKDIRIAHLPEHVMRIYIHMYAYTRVYVCVCTYSFACKAFKQNFSYNMVYCVMVKLLVISFSQIVLVCFTVFGAMLLLPWCHWINPECYGLITCNKNKHEPCAYFGGCTVFIFLAAMTVDLYRGNHTHD